MVEAPEGQDAESQIGFDSLVHHMLYESGKSGIQLARELGRSDNFIWSTLRNNSMPRVDLLIRIANACGYEILLRGRGEEYVLTVDDGEISAWSDFDLKLVALLNAVGKDGSDVIKEFCSSDDRSRLIDSGVTAYQRAGNRHVFYGHGDKVVMCCYYDSDGNRVVSFSN